VQRAVSGELAELAAGGAQPTGSARSVRAAAAHR